MRTLGGLSIALLMAGGLFGQGRGNGWVNPTPRLTGNFGNVVFPGGTPATYPGVTRSFGNVVFPGGSGPKMVVPGTPASITDPTFGLRLGNTVAGRSPYSGYGRPGDRGRGQRGTTVYAYPVYVGGFYDPSYSYPLQAGPQDQAPPQNVTVIYPPQPAPQAAPVMLYPGTAGGNTGQASDSESNFRMYQAPSNQPPAEPAKEEQPTGYLLAFKDHTIYSAVAYWVDGDTLHYFTSGNKHNQASLSLIDRELTERLNRESGMALNLPPAKQ